jgi:nitrogen regulatory protein P-II 1
MWSLVLFVLDDPTKLDEVLVAWEEAGVGGATVLESTGMGRRRGYLDDDVPLFPSIRSLLHKTSTTNRTLFAIVSQQVDIPVLVAKTEAVVGNLDSPHTGILIVAPLGYVKGVRQQGGG